MQKTDKIFVAGHRGLVGSALVRHLTQEGYHNILVAPKETLDLREAPSLTQFFETERPDFVFLAAAKVGGILANDTQGADFIRDNLLIQTHVIDAAYRSGVKKLVFLGSSCIYPKLCPQPIKEDYLLTGLLEPTNAPYAIAKIAGITMCQAYRKQYGFKAISLMPTNLFGPGDNFDLETSHVLPAMMRRFHEAKQQNLPEVVIWGTGGPRREFLHVDDFAAACVHLTQHYDEGEIINVGTGEDIAISELAQMMAEVVGYTGAIAYDASKPDGTPRKLLDVTRLNALGWQAKVPLRERIVQTYAWYLENMASLRLEPSVS